MERILTKDLTEKNLGSSVLLKGWVNSFRDHGGVVFTDLRDRWGVVQLVINPENKKAFKIAESLRTETVVKVIGKLRERPSDAINKSLVTGSWEVEVEDIEVLNPAKVLPFNVDQDNSVDESLRLRYRYLDLRRERMRKNIILRHNVVLFMRNYLSQKDFIEIETPILAKSTPEGARDFLVPSRMHPGKFYALPQSPQQYKQLLMVAGFEKYFQFARCLRDEDLRGDRQPEFTQLDLEMSFCSREDILVLIEDMYIKLVEKLTNKKFLFKPWPRLSHQEVIDSYGIDKPDLRFGMKFHDLSPLFSNTECQIFQKVLTSGGKIKGIKAEGCFYSRQKLDDLVKLAQNLGAKGLVWLTKQEGEIKCSLKKYLKEKEINDLINEFEVKEGDLVLIVAGEEKEVAESLGGLRLEMGERLNLRDPNILAFAYVIDFPLFEWDEENKRWDPSHHMFTMPHHADIPLLDSDPGQVRSYQYDMVCNGYELGGGSIRIHRRDLQSKIFNLIGLEEKEAQEKFGHMLEAFEFGAPPHGGIAPGLDRLLMILAGEPNIREVMAFPKNQTAQELMMGSPSEVDPEQLSEVNIQIRSEQKGENGG